MSSSDLPRGPIVDASGSLNPAWAVWLSRVGGSANAVRESGPSANRPTDGLWIGRPYFDTTLGYEINVKSVPPRPAPAVWVNGDGVVV